jgi:hypothetical protein
MAALGELGHKVNGDNMVEGQGGITEDISAADVLQQAEGIENVVAEQEEAPAESVEVKADGTETEVKAEPKKEEQSQEERLFASKFAALSRKEKALREKERQLETRMQELEQRLNSAQKDEPKQQEEPLELRLKKNPFEALQSLGFDYETLAQIALNDGKLTPELQMKLMREELERQYNEKFQQLESKLTEKEQKELEQRHAQVIENFKQEIAEHVGENAAEYELLAIEGEDGVQLVYDVIEEHYNSTGEILDKKDAAMLVENHLLEEAKKRVGLSKIKKLLGASEPKVQTEPKQAKPSVTLSNEQSQTSQPADRFLSDEESLAQAAKLIKWVE